MSLIIVRQLRDRSGRLLLGCGCGWQAHVDLSSAPEELMDRTVADLWRQGRWRCRRCGGMPAAMVYVHDLGMVRQVERYASDEP